MMMTGGIAYVY